MTNLNINFLNNSATVNQTKEFFTAIDYETNEMLVLLINDTISRYQKQLARILEDETLSEEEQEAESKVLANKIAQEESALKEVESILKESKETHDKVIDAMTLENHDHFKNDRDTVKTVLRVLGSWNNSKLVKYAIIPAFESPELYNCLESIHTLSKAGEDGQIIMSKEVKQAYKNASKELESIIKKTFSLPFETPYTDKTRVKLTAEDKKLLNDCYVKGFKNKFSVDAKTGEVSFSERQVNTLVKVKENKKTGKVTYNYSGLATTIANIVIKHYFA